MTKLWRNYVNIFSHAFGAQELAASRASRARGAPSARSNSLTRALRALGARLRRAPPRSEIIFGDFSFGDNYLRNALKTESTNSEIFSPKKKGMVLYEAECTFCVTNLFHRKNIFFPMKSDMNKAHRSSN